MEENVLPERKSLTERFLEACCTTEEHLYKRHFQQELWSLTEFCAIASGLSLDNYQAIEANPEIYTFEEQKQAQHANKIKNKFLKHFKNSSLLYHPQEVKEEYYMLPWRYIKWFATNNVSVRKTFLKALPLYLIELLIFEFLDPNSPIKTKNKFSREYHMLFYLEHAKKIQNENPELTNEQIYNHRHMQTILRQIPKKKGKYYRKSTIKKSWLPKLKERDKGRPPKISKTSY